MRTTGTVAVALAGALLLAAVDGHLTSTRPHPKDNRLSISTYKFPSRHFHDKARPIESSRGRGVVGVTESPTDPPEPSQPLEFLVSFSDFCTGQLALSSMDYGLFSGNYTVPPPPIVPMVNSGEFNYGFAVQGDAVTGDVNGTLMYTCPNCTVWPTDIPLGVGFASVQGEWVFELSYWTPLMPVIMSSDIGPRAVYNLLIGHRFDLVRC
ncbi:Hypothetical protein, putative [Bodo saltans]|uniref:Membrane-associated protein n=1 Tax=Bodo saltans TaxID=75058 RepID=A0A0S4J568_BODSA|nr:Hypothetical protein, putative [Bodo saltans]|eukprot:CUG86621.1 Hypothetical protein, putative [Bodo saltans]